MRTLQRLFAVIGITAGTYSILALLIGPTTIVHAFVTLTAIDHWHPNWPETTTVDTTAEALPPLTVALAVTMLLAYIATGYLQRWNTPPALSSAMLNPAAQPIAMAGRALLPYTPTREGFHADLTEMLRDAGLAPTTALEVADAAMLTADTDTPADWAGRVREEALTAAGMTGHHSRVLSCEPHLAQTVRFLQDYGYRALLMKRIGDRSTTTEPDDLNFDGILVYHRTTAHAAENALIELLITAHQAHMASMDDNGERGKANTVQRYAQRLKHVCTKLALRGFVPPELDAAIGRDGTATAEELERWAIAQVVAACSPMTRMPLPTVERTPGSDR